MRNQRANGLALSGCPADVTGPDPVKAVVLHWSYTGVDTTAPPPNLDNLLVRRYTPSYYPPITIFGALIGRSAQTRWQDATSALVYRAILHEGELSALGFRPSAGVQAGNGVFGIVLPTGTTAIRDQRSPFETNGYSAALAAFDGVAMTGVYYSNEEPMGETLLFDREEDTGLALAGRLFNAEAHFELRNIHVPGITKSLISFVSFGGQNDVGGHDIDPRYARETLWIGVGSGPPCCFATRFFDGIQGEVSPQLMDARTVALELPTGGQSLLIEVDGDEDCIVPGAVILTQK